MVIVRCLHIQNRLISSQAFYFVSIGVTMSTRYALGSTASLSLLFLTPLISLLYYSSTLAAFFHGMKHVEANVTDAVDNHTFFYAWGTHWSYRAIAELFSIYLAAFVSAGIAKDRAKNAALLCG